MLLLQASCYKKTISGLRLVAEQLEAVFELAKVR
jgi:hypothetical protein